jgi:DNA repair exonuclease SbcCD ATPase subunit
MSRKTSGPGVSFFAFQDIITSVVGIFILITILLILDFLQRVEASATAKEASNDAAPVIEAIQTLKDDISRMSQDVEARSQAQSKNARINKFNRDEEFQAMKNKVAVIEQQIKKASDLSEDLEQKLESAEEESSTTESRRDKINSQESELQALLLKLKVLDQQLGEFQNDSTPVFRDVSENGRFLTIIVLERGAIELKDAMTKTKESWQGSQRLDRLREWLATAELGNRQLYIVVKPGGAGDFQAMRRDLSNSNTTYGFNVSGEGDRISLRFEMP